MESKNKREVTKWQLIHGPKATSVAAEDRRKRKRKQRRRWFW